MLAPAAQLDFHVNIPVFQVPQFTGGFCIYFAAVTPKYGCVCACDCTTVLQSIRFQVPNVEEIETLCQRACSCPQLRGGPEQRDFTASCLHGAISPTCAFSPISHLQSRKWELGSTDENERNVFETPQKGPVFVPTIRHHQNEPTDPPIWCWHQHQTQMLVCHLCFREGGQFAWPKTVSAGRLDSSSSSHDSLEPQPQPKKYRRTAVHSHGEQVLDVGAMSRMVVLCICSPKGGTTFTVPLKDKYSFLFCMLLC